MWNNVLTHIVKYLTSFDVKWNSPLYICEANISQRSYFTWRSHISLAEGEFRWKKKSKSFRLAFFFLAPRTGLEPVTSPTVSDCGACANIARATRQSHSRLARSPAHFRYSLLCAFDGRETAVQAVVLFVRQVCANSCFTANLEFFNEVPTSSAWRSLKASVKRSPSAPAMQARMKRSASNLSVSRRLAS